MAKKAAKADADFIEADEIGQETPESEERDSEPEFTPPAPAIDKGVSKADACRAALAEGITEAEDAIDFAKARFGIDIKPTDFALYKSKAKKQEGGKRGGAGRRPGRKPKADRQAVEGYLAPPPAGNEADLLDALETMKPLIASLGAERVKRLVDLLG